MLNPQPSFAGWSESDRAAKPPAPVQLTLRSLVMRAGVNPLGDEDVACAIEARIVRRRIHWRLRAAFRGKTRKGVLNDCSGFQVVHFG